MAPAMAPAVAAQGKALFQPVAEVAQVAEWVWSRLVAAVVLAEELVQTRMAQMTQMTRTVPMNCRRAQPQPC